MGQERPGLKGSGWFLPSTARGGRSLQGKDFALIICCHPSLFHLLCSLCRDRLRASSQEAFPLLLLRLLLIDRLEIPKKKNKKNLYFVTLFYLLFAKGRAMSQVESLLRSREVCCPRWVSVSGTRD